MEKIIAFEQMSFDFQGIQWNLVCPEIWISLLKNDKGEINSKLKVLLALELEKKRSFKAPLEVKNHQLLFACLTDVKKVLVGSKNLNYELSLIDYYQAVGESEKIKDLIAHTEKIAEIPLENSPMVIDFISKKNGLPLLNEAEFATVDLETQKLAQKLIVHLGEYKQSFVEKISDFALDLTANFMLIRVHVLKFLAILPCLDHDKGGGEVKRLFLESLRRLILDSQVAEIKKARGQARPLPLFYLRLVKVVYAIAKRTPDFLLAKFIRSQVSFIAKRFIAGKDIKNAKKSLKSLLSSGRDATLDQLGELVVSRKEADIYCQRVLSVINGLERTIAKGSRNLAGIPRAHVSIKVSALAHDLKPYAFDYLYEQISPRLIKILKAAQEREVFINVDAEHYHYRDVIFDVYKKVLLETDELREFADTGIVVQAYLRDGYEHFLEVLELAKERKIRMPIRLVKGAYWDAETVEADAHNFEPPQFLNKEETDIHFRQIVFRSLQEGEFIQLAIASHNIQDHCYGEIMREQKFPDAPTIEHQCLHMTYEALSFGMTKMGWAVRNYIPIGDLIVGMAYLVRRIMENSSQVGILTIMRSHMKGLEFKNPRDILNEKKLKRELIFDKSVKEMSRKFKNVFPLRPYLEKHFKKFEMTFNAVTAEFKSRELQKNDERLQSVSPGETSLILAEYERDTKESVDQKVNRLFQGYTEGSWQDFKKSDRVAKLLFSAELMLLERDRLSSIIVIESGKTIEEAYADVDEAIDFIKFYAEEEVSLYKREGVLRSKGVLGVIAPWNFPLAIPCGMTVAALVSGHTVLLKPSEFTPLIATEMLKIFRKAGIDEATVDIVYGDGVVGKAITEHPLVSGVVFTGSKRVGLGIYQAMAGTMTSTRYDFRPVHKTVINELGGKNAIIVTSNAELDETVSGIIYSAFAHAGQKCSACSRVLVAEDIKEAFLERFVDAVKDLPMGSPAELRTTVNPLISERDYNRLKDLRVKMIAEANQHGGVVHVDRILEGQDNTFGIGPMVIELPIERAFIDDSYSRHEIFAPVVHIMSYRGLDQAIKAFNATDYALTGGVFCQSQDDIDEIISGVDCGNFYVNRSNTGARVAIEPFGGYKLSGTGPKAGGKDYLWAFHRQNPRYEMSDAFSVQALPSEDIEYGRPSGLSYTVRQEKLLDFLSMFVTRFEVFFPGINELAKDRLYDFIDRIRNDEFKMDERVFPNREIPGQLSFDKKEKVLGNGLFLFTRLELSLDQFFSVILSITFGNGVTVLCANPAIKKVWDQVFTLLQINGFSSVNIQVLSLDMRQVDRLLEIIECDYVVYEPLSGELTNFLAKAKTFGLEDRKILRLFPLNELRLEDDFTELITLFTHTQSMAINTMRHGAPMEITL